MRYSSGRIHSGDKMGMLPHPPDARCTSDSLSSPGTNETPVTATTTTLTAPNSAGAWRGPSAGHSVPRRPRGHRLRCRPHSLRRMARNPPPLPVVAAVVATAAMTKASTVLPGPAAGAPAEVAATAAIVIAETAAVAAIPAAEVAAVARRRWRTSPRAGWCWSFTATR